VSLITTAPRYHVALVDKLPGGFEILNENLLNTVQVKTYPNYNYRWFNHANHRDERAEAFCEILYPGTYVYQYNCRATTTGYFNVPPAKVEEMYSPEIFGRSASNIVIIE